MPWFAWVFVTAYAFGWIVYIATNEPYDAFDGAVLIFVGVLWPLFFLGWLVSRPFR